MSALHIGISMSVFQRMGLHKKNKNNKKQKTKKRFHIRTQLGETFMWGTQKICYNKKLHDLFSILSTQFFRNRK